MIVHHVKPGDKRESSIKRLNHHQQHIDRQIVLKTYLTCFCSMIFWWEEDKELRIQGIITKDWTKGYTSWFWHHQGVSVDQEAHVWHELSSSAWFSLSHSLSLYWNVLALEINPSHSTFSSDVTDDLFFSFSFGSLTFQCMIWTAIYISLLYGLSHSAVASLLQKDCYLISSSLLSHLTDAMINFRVEKILFFGSHHPSMIYWTFSVFADWIAITLGSVRGKVEEGEGFLCHR